MKKTLHDRHGYNNTSGFRTGDPDYACSSFVAGAYRYAGLIIPANVYAAQMKKIFKTVGSKDVTEQVNLRTGEGLKVGDIVLAPGKHTEIVVRRNHRLAGARGCPNSGRPENNKHIMIHSWNIEEPMMVYSDQLMLIDEFQRYFDSLWMQTDGAGSSHHVIKVLTALRDQCGEHI